MNESDYTLPATIQNTEELQLAIWVLEKVVNNEPQITIEEDKSKVLWELYDR